MSIARNEALQDMREPRSAQDTSEPLSGVNNTHTELAGEMNGAEYMRKLSKSVNSGLLATGVLGLFLTGCAQVPGADSGIRRYIGCTTVRSLNVVTNHSGFCVKEIRNLGLTFSHDGRISIGYTRDKIVEMPSDARVFIEVHSREQFDWAKELVSELKEIGIGAGKVSADSTNSAAEK